jgi:hypothetical protein
MPITINSYGIIRIVLILVFQVLVVKNMVLPMDHEGLGRFLFFPAAIIFLPSQLTKPIVLIIAFIVGLIVDMFYDTPGICAGSLVILAYIRPLAFEIIEPRLGVKLGQESAGYNFGFASLLIYSSMLMLIFCFTYYFFEYFTLYYIFDILIKAVYSFFLSMVLIIIYIIIFRPKI